MLQWKRVRTVQVKTQSNNREREAREAGMTEWYLLKPNFEASEQHSVSDR